ncbi:MAG: hypothetical protein K2P81_14740 [Bacteriovoracaceae bacterium]|nr:hypothetical protein [Bacteriovoracaceae bacterium]
MGSFWPLIAGILLSLSALAQNETAQFIFRGQPQEHVALERSVVETRTRTEMQNDTCTRQIPYQEQECGPETRYRQECTWVPARQECGRRDERRCRQVTRYRQECSNGPSRRECRTFPGGQVCTNRPGREICEDRGGSEECREVNGRRVCRRTGGRVCRTVPGERDCRSTPPETRCTTEPGERICRQVSYPDQECTTESVPWCTTIPGQNVCRDIPYQENVCRNVTRYRTETYACQRPVEVPYNVTIPVHGQLDVAFLNPQFSQEVNFTAALSSAKKFVLTAQAPQGVVVGTRAQEATVESQADSILVKQRIDVAMADIPMVQSQVTQNLSAVVIDFAAKKLSFTAQGIVEMDDVLEVTLEGRKKKLFGTSLGKAQLSGSLKVLEATTAAAGEGITAVQIDLSKTDISAIEDKKNFKMIMTHQKVLPEGFSWSGQIPEIKSQKEAQAEAIR